MGLCYSLASTHHCMEAIGATAIRSLEKCENMFKGLRLLLEGFVVIMHEGTCETGSRIPRPTSRGISCTGHTSRSALWQQTWHILISIITWHFQFHLVNVSILHLKYKYMLEVKAVLRATTIVTSRCPLMTGIVASQCLLARDAVLMTCNLTPLISACLKPLKIILPQ